MDIKLGPGVRGGRIAILGTSGMKAVVLTASCADMPAARATPEHPISFVSLEDDLMRMFGSRPYRQPDGPYGIKKASDPAQHDHQASNAHRRNGGNNFGIRKRLLEYDDVMNKQRNVVYRRRNHALFGERWPRPRQCILFPWQKT